MSYYCNRDCFDEFKHIEPDTIDLVVVDLPYGQTACKWDVKIDLEEMWKQLKRICTKRCVYVFFTTTKYGVELIQSNPKWFRYDIVWEKTANCGYLNANRMVMRKHEMIYIFSKKQSTYNPQKTKGKPYYVPGNNQILNAYGTTCVPSHENKTGDRHPTSIIKFNNPIKSLHRTQKPTDLCEWLIRTYSNENDMVLDFCMGSGSTIEACINTNRQYIGIEMNKENYDVADKRLKEITESKKNNAL